MSSTKAQPITTWTALAEAIGRNRKTLHRLRQRDDWPKGVPSEVPARGFTAKHIDRLRSWLEVELQEDRAGDAAISDEEARQLRLQDQRLRIEQRQLSIEAERLRQEEERGNRYTAEQVERIAGGMAAEFVGILNEIEATWPGRFARKAIDDLRAGMPQLLDTYRARLVERAAVDLADLEEAKKRTERKRGRGRPGRKRKA